MSKIKILYMMCFCSVCAYGSVVTLKDSVDGTVFDWTVGSNYVGGSAPTAGDTVVIPANVTANLTAGDTDSFNLVNSLFQIKPEAGAKLLVTVTGESVTNSLHCAVSSLEAGELKRFGATLEKAGAGTLILGNGSNDGRITNNKYYCYDYGVDLTVTEGTLVLPQNRTYGTSLVVGAVHVAESASLMLSSPASFELYSFGLSGAGTVFYPNKDVNSAGKTLYVKFHIYATDGIEKSVFSGKLSGYIQLQVKHPAVVHLTGDASDFNGSPVVAGYLGVKGFGMVDDAVSPIGSGNVNFSGTGATVEYLGTEPETTDKPFWWTGFGTLDAGAFGGVTFTGKFSNTGGGQYVLHLTGSNTTECVLENAFISVYNDDETLKGTPCLKKTGSGTWRMADNDARDIHGVICVEDGTLKFDSIAEQGRLCSLGYSDALRECTHGAFAGIPSVDYAFLLGGDSTTGTLEYSGDAVAGNATRPVAVRSKGRFVSDSAFFRLEDVYALGAGDKKIALAGESKHGNRATGFSDGNDGGRLSVVKEGEGEWILYGTNTFTGSVSAKGGKMIVWNQDKRYTWFRLTIKENGYGRPGFDLTDSVGAGKNVTDSERGMVQLTELELYDADGHNIAKGIVMDSEEYTFDINKGYAGLKEGHAGCGRRSGISFNGSLDGGNWRMLSNLFANGVIQMKYKYAEGTGIVLADDSTWVPIVFRLPANESRTAVAMDLVSGVNASGVESYCGRSVTAFSFEGSVDGENWDLLFDEKTDVEPPAASGYFLSDTNEVYNAYTPVARKDKGFGFTRTEAAEGTNKHAFTGVGAANGGVLDIVGAPYTASGLVIDAAASAGVISNVIFAADGYIDVENVESLDFDSLELPGDYSHLDGYENLSGWELRINGESCVSKVVTRNNGRLTLRNRGLRLIFR